jgi:hypothetical protein
VRAARRLVLRVEVNDRGVSANVREAHRFPRDITTFEVRSRSADGQETGSSVGTLDRPAGRSEQTKAEGEDDRGSSVHFAQCYLSFESKSFRRRHPLVMARRPIVPLLAALALALACKGKPVQPAPGPSAVVAPSPIVTGCGALGCKQYESPDLAFEEAIRGDARVVSIGEAHAPKGARVPSSARRFTDLFLPLLKGRASDLVVELMMPPPGCAARVSEVKKVQAPVTTHQAPEDQGEYVAMGEAARKLGIVPDLLRPTCADLDAIQDAGDDAIDVSLRTIEKLTREKVQKLIERDAHTPGDEGKIVVTYGGAIHNDRDPPAERRVWSFGPALDHATGGRYVEIDLYVPEFIDGSDAWSRLEWFSHYERAKLGERTTMFRPHDRTFVIVFPMSRESSSE